MERALGDGSVPEEAGGDLPAAAQLEGERHAGGQGNASGDDGDARDHSLGEVADVHRTALAAAAARARAEEFVHEFLDREPLRDGVAVAAERGGDEVTGLERRADSHCGGLLALALMDRARHGALEKQELHAILELADEHQAAVQLEQERRIMRRGGVRARSVRGCQWFRHGLSNASTMAARNSAA